MYCSVCGNQNPDDARFCTSCGRGWQSRPNNPVPPPPPGYTPPQPLPQGAPSYATPVDIPNYLVQAILVTICCLPAGIVSIVFAAQVNGKIVRGDIVGARSDSQNAKTWAWVSFGLGLAAGAIYFFLMLIGVAGAGF